MIDEFDHCWSSNRLLNYCHSLAMISSDFKGSLTNGHGGAVHLVARKGDNLISIKALK